MQDALVMILGGGRGARLFPLTKHRSEPAVPIAAEYRLIDIPISNCINSGFSRIFVLTQYMSVSLHRHIANTYKFTPFRDGFVEVLAAQVTNERADWFKGTADAIRQNLHYIRADAPRDVLMLCGDQLYRMNFREPLQWHRESEADVTLAVTPVTAEQAFQYGIVKLDNHHRIIEFVEKPRDLAQLQKLRVSSEELARYGIKKRQGNYLANMGMYFFKTEALFRLLNQFPNANDFVTEILITSLKDVRVNAYVYDGFWEDLGSVRTYYETSLALCGENPPFDFHTPEGVVYTRMRNLPAARVLKAEIDQCLVADGCIVDEGSVLQKSILGVRSRLGKNVTMRGVVMMGANYYEDDSPALYKVDANRVPLGVGEGSVLQKAILDKNCRIGKRVRIINEKNVSHADTDSYYIRDGIVIIPDSVTIPDGTVI